MELSQFTDYSLRVLIFVGLREHRLSDDGTVGEPLPSVRAIAAAYGISQNHLVKVVHRLGQLGYLLTYRGRGGGIALAVDPCAINVGKLVRATENLAVVECLSNDKPGTCCIAPVCELKRVLTRARDAFLKTLDGYSLADLIKSRGALRAALGQPV